MSALLTLGLFLLGVLLLERGADLLGDHIASLARRTRLSPILLGLLTVGIEWEELGVVLIATAGGHVEVAVGTVIGANIANLAGSFSLGLLVRPIPINPPDRLALGAMLGLSLLTIPLFWRGEIDALGGLVLVALFGLYLGGLGVALARGLLRWKATAAALEPADGQGLIGEVGLLLGGLGLLLLGAELVVQAAVELTRLTGLSGTVIGLTVVALATTLPDKIIAIVGAWRGHGAVVVANAAGSNICNLLLVLGLAALLEPLPVEETTRTVDLPVLLGLSTLVCLLALRPRLGRAEGTLLLTLYLGYLVYRLTA